MIEYPRNRQQTIPESSVKIVGLGGAGSNMLDRVALDGIEGAELLSMNTDVRTLTGTVAGEKIQLGRNLTKGLGTGGDPELGEKAIQEAEDEIRDSLRDRQIVFLCVGLGGGTGSGAAPILVRLAREAGAFVVVFATMPFAFEGRRRRTQAEESLNQLAVLSNALVTFDNGRMGELVLPKQGVHEAFSAADRMISDSITAVARLVLRPGLINVGLDELMSALKTTRSRCLFGSGLGRGENRAQSALKAALNSPLLDRGSLLEDATTVLVHICGGDDMTLYEVELLMQGLTKFIPENAHLLFGAATDKQMKDALSVTIISALPEERLQAVPYVEEIAEPDEPVAEEEIQEEEAPASKAGADVEEEIRSEAKDPVLSLVEEEPEGLEDEESGEEIEDDEAGEESIVAEEDIEFEPDELDDFAAPGLKVISDKEEPEPEAVADPEPVQDPEPEIEEFVATKSTDNQGELLLEGAPKGRFDGESPNVVKDGEDLDIPPYLRKRSRRR
jgi:cell division protein FtsZ